MSPGEAIDVFGMTFIAGAGALFCGMLFWLGWEAADWLARAINAHDRKVIRARRRLRITQEKPTPRTRRSEAR